MAGNSISQSPGSGGPSQIGLGSSSPSSPNLKGESSLTLSPVLPSTKNFLPPYPQARPAPAPVRPQSADTWQRGRIQGGPASGNGKGALPVPPAPVELTLPAWAQSTQYQGAPFPQPAGGQGLQMPAWANTAGPRLPKAPPAPAPDLAAKPHMPAFKPTGFKPPAATPQPAPEPEPSVPQPPAGGYAVRSPSPAEVRQHRLQRARTRAYERSTEAARRASRTTEQAKSEAYDAQRKRRLAYDAANASRDRRRQRDAQRRAAITQNAQMNASARRQRLSARKSAMDKSGLSPFAASFVETCENAGLTQRQVLNAAKQASEQYPLAASELEEVIKRAGADDLLRGLRWGMNAVPDIAENVKTVGSKLKGYMPSFSSPVPAATKATVPTPKPPHVTPRTPKQPVKPVEPAPVNRRVSRPQEAATGSAAPDVSVKQRGMPRRVQPQAGSGSGAPNVSMSDKPRARLYDGPEEAAAVEPSFWDRFKLKWPTMPQMPGMPTTGAMGKAWDVGKGTFGSLPHGLAVGLNAGGPAGLGVTALGGIARAGKNYPGLKQLDALLSSGAGRAGSGSAAFMTGLHGSLPGAVREGFHQSVDETIGNFHAMMPESLTNAMGVDRDEFFQAVADGSRGDQASQAYVNEKLDKLAPVVQNVVKASDPNSFVAKIVKFVDAYQNGNLGEMISEGWDGLSGMQQSLVLGGGVMLLSAIASMISGQMGMGVTMGGLGLMAGMGGLGLFDGVLETIQKWMEGGGQPAAPGEQQLESPAPAEAPPVETPQTAYSAPGGFSQRNEYAAQV